MENKIFQAALNKWGLPAQVAMAHGEMGELATALTQYFVQEKIGPENVVDEIADVMIMMKQMSIAIESEKGCEPGAVSKRYKEKLERLAGLVGITYGFDLASGPDETVAMTITKNDPDPFPVGTECEAYTKDTGWFPAKVLSKRHNGNFEVSAVEALGGHRLYWTADLRPIKPKITQVVDVNVNLAPKTEQTTLDEREEILLKWPNAQPLRDFIIEHDTLEPGSLLVNHYKVDPLVATEQMILNGELLHWYNMQYWFVIEAPRWEAEKKHKINQDAKALYNLVIGGDVNNLPWGAMKHSVKNLFIGLAELGIKPPRKELPKETEPDFDATPPRVVMVVPEAGRVKNEK